MKYFAHTNYCKCHPETCCCNDYAVYFGNPHWPESAEKYDDFFSEKTAKRVAKSLNRQLKLKKELSRLDVMSKKEMKKLIGKLAKELNI